MQFLPIFWSFEATALPGTIRWRVKPSPCISHLACTKLQMLITQCQDWVTGWLEENRAGCLYLNNFRAGLWDWIQDGLDKEIYEFIYLVLPPRLIPACIPCHTSLLHQAKQLPLSLSHLSSHLSPYRSPCLCSHLNPFEHECKLMQTKGSKKDMKRTEHNMKGQYKDAND